MKQKSLIDVEWSYDNSHDSHISWYVWQPSNRLISNALESPLGWPEGTLNILEKAFLNNLSRSAGWDLNAIPTRQLNAYKKAAQVFKRGVAVKDQEIIRKSGSYSIEIQNSAQPPVEATAEAEVLFIVDYNVAKAWRISESSNAKIFQLEEENKNLQSVAAMLVLIDHHPTKQHFSIIGGGVLCDVASFALSLRGKAFTLIPTTLLAMVDASVGGKTGVNFAPYGKNQIGSFSFPEKVIIWPKWLNTLNLRHVRGGQSECFKHALISGDTQLITQLSRELNGLCLSQLLKPLIEVKANIIRKDPAERGLRSVLNLGHTLAHGLEHISHEQSHNLLTHGEAVGLGLAFAIKLSEKMAGFEPKLGANMIEALKTSKCLINKTELQAHLSEKDISSQIFFEKLYSKLKHDKKNHDGLIRWILLKSPGVFYRPNNSYLVPIDKKIIEDVWINFLKLIE